MKKAAFISVILVLVSVGSVGAVTNINSCGTINTSDGFVLSQNLSDSTCKSSGGILLEQEAFGVHQNKEKKIKYMEGELLVKFKSDISKRERSWIHSGINSKVLREFKSVKGLQHLELPPGEDVKGAVEYYNNNPLVEYAEPNYIVEILATPNDPMFGDLWGMAKINATEAWDISTGSGNVVVAVVDTGVDYNHEDLASNMWVNPGESCTDGVDNDGNGYVDDCYGIDTYNDDSDPMDDNGHGTHVSGTIGALGNNGIGVVGVNWNVNIMAVKFISASNNGTTADAIQALDYVLDMKNNQGVNIVATSNSWYVDAYSTALKNAIEAQMNAGILFIAAACNDANDNDVIPCIPASYDLPNIISVAATTSSNGLASFSNYGGHTVHVGAPGVSILSTTPGDTYSYYQGTSMATPHVSGLAALLKDQNASLDWKQIKNLILTGGKDTPALSGLTITGKTINAYDSLTCTNSSLLSVLRPMQDYFLFGESIDLRAISIFCQQPVDVNVTIYYSNGSIVAMVPLLDNGAFPDQAAGDGVFTSSWTPSPQENSYRLVFNNTLEWKSLNILVGTPKTLVVNQTATCTTGDVYYNSILEAVTNANRSDEVIVCPGAYNENIFVNKPMDIKSYSLNPEDTVVMANDTIDPVFKVYLADWTNISGFKIEGSDLEGIALISSDNALIANNNVSNNYIGIHLSSSSSNTLKGNTANSNAQRGIYLESSDGNVLMNNNANSNNRGIYLLSSSGNELTGNTVSSNTHQGIYLDFSGSNTLTGNTMSLNAYNFWIDGSAVSDFVQTIDTSNTVDGKPIHYRVGVSNVVMDSSTNVGYIGVVNGINITIKDLTLTKNKAGVLFVNTSDSLIENVTVQGNYDGFYLAGSKGNTLSKSTANSNMQHGIYLWNSAFVITDNIASSNSDTGIYLYKSNSGTITNNTANSNGMYGIYLNSSSVNTITSNIANSNTRRGISLWSSSSNTITGNTANTNNRGISVAASSNSNTLTGNTANSNTYYGILLSSSTGNIFTDNTAQENPSYDFYVWASSDAGCNNEISGTTVSGGRSFLYYNSSVSLYDTLASELVLCNADYSDVNNVTIMGSDVLDNNGILLVRTDFTNISNSDSSNNGYGINIKSSNSNTLKGNIASNNGYGGFYFYDSSSNLIYNNYLDNIDNAGFSGTNNNDWNTTNSTGPNIIGGPYIGGNFWANPSGTGLSETCTDADSDGICDSNYTLALGNVDYLPLTFTVTPEITFNITLLQGWNLISLPLTPENTSLDAVLASIEGNYSVVYRWAGCLWTKSTAARNPLAEMTVEYGYWIDMTAPDTLELTGTEPPSTTINVTNTCWNLVGYPSLTPKNLTTVLSPINYTVVYAYINGIWKKSTATRDPLTEMSPGYGYWIDANEDGSYEVWN